MILEHLRRITRKGSIYARTFYGMLALSICVLTIFYFAVNLTLTKHQREQAASSNLALLRLSASSLEVTFDVLAQGMTQTMWNPDFIHYMVAPQQQDQALQHRIIQNLKSNVSSSELISRAYFYSPFSDIVFQNMDLIRTRSALPERERDLLDAYAQWGGPGR